MNFFLGILTGIGICLIYGNYLLYRRKKEETDKHNRAVMKNVISAFDEMARFRGFEKPIEQQLSDAIEREDFQEAARLRDLINKK